MSNGSRAAIIVGVIAVLATVGFIVFTNSKTEDRGGLPANGPEQAAPANNDNTNLPPYLQTNGVNVRGQIDATDSQEVTAQIDDFFFDPTILKVSVGTTVTWTNEGAAVHTVTSAEDSPNGGLDSGNLRGGETYSFTFEEPGTYNYFCVPHPLSMKAVVEVVE